MNKISYIFITASLSFAAVSTAFAANPVSLNLDYSQSQQPTVMQTFAAPLNPGKVMCSANLPEGGKLAILGGNGAKLTELTGNQVGEFSINDPERLAVSWRPGQILKKIVDIRTFCRLESAHPINPRIPCISMIKNYCQANPGQCNWPTVVSCKNL